MRILGVLVGVMLVACGAMVFFGIFFDLSWGKWKALSTIGMGLAFLAYGVFGRTGLEYYDDKKW